MALTSDCDLLGHCLWIIMSFPGKVSRPFAYELTGTFHVIYQKHLFKEFPDNNGKNQVILSMNNLSIKT
ncbi:MAG: hypothetical protein IPO26_21385 [Saprospiraceae bacterium]|nr:hypothetical protein [Saprospiraceae bacterium]